MRRDRKMRDDETYDEFGEKIEDSYGLDETDNSELLDDDTEAAVKANQETGRKTVTRRQDYFRESLDENGDPEMIEIMEEEITTEDDD